MKRDIYREVTDRIVRELEQGVRPWIKPWDAGTAAGRIVRPLRHWLQILKNDKCAIFTAAAHAQRAADYLHGFQQDRAEAA